MIRRSVTSDMKRLRKTFTYIYLKRENLLVCKYQCCETMDMGLCVCVYTPSICRYQVIVISDRGTWV